MMINNTTPIEPTPTYGEQLTSEALTLLLERRGMSKAEAARRCGYTASYLGNLTNDASPISKGATLRIIAGLGISSSELEFLEDNI